MLFLVNSILLLALFCIIIVISMLWPPDSPWAPWWTTKPNIARKMCEMVKVNDKTLIYDLGCGTGNAICIAAKEFNAPSIGIEIDPLRFFNAWFNVNLRFKVKNKVKLLRENFFKINFSEADVFFIYLIPNALIRLAPKFLKEAKKGSLLVSYIYPIPIEFYPKRIKLIKLDHKNRLFLYKFE